jgi:hypothetical protein
VRIELTAKHFGLLIIYFFKSGLKESESLIHGQRALGDLAVENSRI